MAGRQRGFDFLTMVLALLAGPLVLPTAPARAQRRVPVTVDSGIVENTGEEPAVIFATTLRVPEVTWLRLDFAEVLLAGDLEQGTASHLRMTSRADGALQLVNAAHIAQWKNASAYFNGDAVEVELVAHPHTGANRLVITEVIAGIPGEARRTICGPTDDRELSGDARVGRGWTVAGEGRCTAFLINDCNRCLLTAGHCYDQQLQQIHFNVPLSDPDGSVNHPPPSDQYAVDPNSWHSSSSGLGDDWAYFGCFANPSTGLTPYEAQSACFTLAATPPEPAGQMIRVTGYGTVDLHSSPPPNEWNRVLKTHTGSYYSFSDTTVRYQVDTTSGNSGSPVVNEDTSEAIGIHTSGGCEPAGGSNAGTGSNSVDLQAALGAPAGVCTPALVLTKPLPGWGYYRAGALDREIRWPVPVLFAIVAGRDSIPVEASDGPSFVDSVRFSSGNAVCWDYDPSGDLFSCDVLPDGGLRQVSAQAYDPWGHQVAGDDGRALFFKPGDQLAGTCWLAGTRITMSDDSHKKIEDVVVGDVVLAYDLLDDDLVPARVTTVYHHSLVEMPDYYLVINGHIRVTPNHLLYVNSVLALAEDVRVGDILSGIFGSGVVVISVEEVYERVPTYSFEMGVALRACNPYYAYIADGIVAYPLKNSIASMAASVLYDYEMTDLGTMAGAQDSHAYGTNDAGMVVGTSGGHAFLWEYATGMTDLGRGSAYAVNRSGQAVGESDGRAVLWDYGGGMTDLTPGAAYDINDSGMAVGLSNGQAFLWEAGQTTYLQSGAAYGINELGQVVGESGGRAVLWDYGGGMTDLGPGVAHDINDAGRVVGEADGQAFLWEAGQMTHLGSGVAYGVNESGQVVGESDGHAFLWTSAGGMTYLSDRIWEWSGWTPVAARDINDIGQLVGDGDVRGEVHAFHATSTSNAEDLDGDGVPDVCELGEDDCNNNGIPDDQDITNGTSEDCNDNGLPDECDIADATSADCNGNGVPDECDLDAGTSQDCNGNAVPDECDIDGGTSEDCNNNGIPDDCDITAGTSQDNDSNGIPDECQIPAAPSDPSPPDGADNVSTQPMLSVYVANWYGGPTNVYFYELLSPENLVVDSENDWNAGIFDGTITDGSGNLRLARDNSMYGDGRDGDLTVSSGTFVLQADMYYNDVTVEAGAVLDTRGHTLRVAGTLSNYGTITDSFSGGAGGAGGAGGRGQDPKQNDNPPGPSVPVDGECGQPGQDGLPGAGRGGDGGGGGGGGGGAWWGLGNVDADGGWNPDGDPGPRGPGGAGGNGGGYVRIHACSLANFGDIHADAADGENGQDGGDGKYRAAGGIDLAGGGGGGGAGGDGGNGGSVEIYYLNLQNAGAIHAYAGDPGSGGAGGGGHFLRTGATIAGYSEGAQGACGGGDGGTGEHRRNQSSSPGTRGSDGAPGREGAVSLTHFLPDFVALGHYESTLYCLGEIVDWTHAMKHCTLPAGTNATVSYSTGDGIWYADIAQVPDSECIKFRLTLETANTTLTPLVHAITITFRRSSLVGNAANVPSGSRASSQWQGLASWTTYCWYAVAEDPCGASTPSQLWCFTTGSGADCPGDLNGDGVIDLTDLSMLLANYGETSGMSYPDGDIDGDGDVDLSDLVALLSVYGTTCE